MGTVWKDAEFPGKRTPNRFAQGDKLKLTAPGYNSNTTLEITEIHYFNCDDDPKWATKFYVFVERYDDGVVAATGTQPESAFLKPGHWTKVE